MEHKAGRISTLNCILSFYFTTAITKKKNFCVQVDAYPVYSMATPTIDGAREVLSYLGAQDPSSTDHTQKVIIVDLREEAVVYINGSPFVLRELDRPVDTLKHVGISGPMVSPKNSSALTGSVSSVTSLNFLFHSGGTHGGKDEGRYFC